MYSESSSWLSRTKRWLVPQIRLRLKQRGPENGGAIHQMTTSALLSVSVAVIRAMLGQ